VSPRDRGRTILVDATRAFEQLAETLNLALGRWDGGASHSFRLADGSEIGPAGSSPGVIDERSVLVGAVLVEGDDFEFRLPPDLARTCRVLASSTGPAPATQSNRS
jgi:hypothetical protein